MKKKNATYYILSFLIPMLMLVITFALAKVYPFGNNTAVVGDMKNQYAAILTYGKENFFNIHKLLYSNSLALGGNFYPVLTYYLLSPINLIALFFSNKYIPLFYLINICLNAGFIGLTTHIFLLKSKFINKYVDETISEEIVNVLRLIFSTIFTLSTFYVQYSHTIMWFDAIIFFPLVLLGYEQLVSSNKVILYCISLILLILSNYYIGVMVLVFLLGVTFFWIILSLICKKKCLSIMKKSIYLLLYTILPIGVGSIVLLPSFLGQQAVYQEKYQFSLDKIYPLRDSLGSLLNGNINNTDMPMLYTSIFTLIAVTVFFVSNKIDLKIKIPVFVAIILLLISTWIKGLYMIWHAFSMPNGYSQRETYIILIVLVIIGYIGSTYISSGYIKFITAGAIWSLISVFISYRWNFLSNQQLLVNLVLIIIEIIAVILVHKKDKKYIWVLLFIILGEIGFSYYSKENAIAQTSIPMNSYVKLTEANQNVLTKLGKNDSSFYRIGSTIQLNENDPLMYGYNGLSTYVSQQSNESTDYLSALGYYQKHSWIRWSSFNNGSTAAVNRILGLKYVIAPKNKNLLDATISGKSMSTSDSTPNFPEGIKENSDYFNIYKDKGTLPIVFRTENTAKNIVINYNPADNPFFKLNSFFCKVLEYQVCIKK
ncbi:YfhO family protein [Ligilactobacillus salivarius]|uniref:YfhO family protein n=1 Tax=Ligilactobacillus salivarius TaxID=1624 RepID=UPI0023DDE1AD|nr:YfhO family protein [Ligilactobacillus salivarius]